MQGAELGVKPWEKFSLNILNGRSAGAAKKANQSQ